MDDPVSVPEALQAAPAGAPATPAQLGRRAVVAVLAVAALLFLIATGAAFVTLSSVSEDTDWVEHTLETETQVTSLASANERIETARRGYLIQADGDFVGVLQRSLDRFEADIAALAAMVSDNGPQSARVTRIVRLNAEREALLLPKCSVRHSYAKRCEPGNFSTDRGVGLTRAIRTQLSEMLSEEQRLLSIRNQRQLVSLRQFYVVGGLALALLLALMIAVIVVVSRYNRDLTTAQKWLASANEGLEDAVAARTGELSRANAEIQRFAYIVSHDLRSPLVNVLGFTAELDAARKTLHAYLANLYEERPELKDAAVWLAVDEDLPEALGFIRTSTEKMDRLINSILELSRQGRRALAPERLDMTALAQEVTVTMYQRAEAAGATLTVSPIPKWKATASRWNRSCRIWSRMPSSTSARSAQGWSTSRAGDVRDRSR